MRTIRLTLCAAVIALASIAAGGAGLAHASPTFTINAEGWDVSCGAVAQPCRTTANIVQPYQANASGDYVDIVIETTATSGGGNDVPTIELYPSYTVHTSTNFTCTGTGFSAQSQTDFALGSGAEVSRFRYKGSSSFDCITASLPSGESDNWWVVGADIHPSSAVTWTEDSTGRTIQTDPTDVTLATPADSVILTQCFWLGDTSNGTYDSLASAGFTSGDGYLQVTGGPAGPFTNQSAVVEYGNTLDTADTAFCEPSLPSSTPEMAVMYQAISGS